MKSDNCEWCGVWDSQLEHGLCPACAQKFKGLKPENLRQMVAGWQPGVPVFDSPDINESWDQAFNTCKQAQAPITAIINSQRWTLYPDGRSYLAQA